MEDLRSDTLLALTTEVKGYKILPPCVLYARIGAGGMGAVYRGHHLNLDIDVAVKCLKPTLADDDPTFVDRFKREARSAAKINHQNVIRVFDVAEDHGLHYLIMEFVAGETARQRVERKGPLKLGEALQIVYEAAMGLGEAHRMGIIHRDIKPDNLLISSRGQVKVADLGLAKPAFSSGQSMLSKAGQVMGTPPYMPPEQWGESSVTSASDVWAMGAALYYLLAGREAITGESVAAIMSKIVLQDFPDVREFCPDIPDSVIAVLNKATAKLPGDRYLDACELANAIGLLPDHRISLADTDAGTTELVTMLSPPPNARINEIKKLLATNTSTASATTPTRKTKARSQPTPEGTRRPWVAVLLVLLLAAGGGAGYLYRDVLLAPNPVNPVDDKLSQIKSMQNEGKYVAALLAARAVFAADPQLMDEALVADLQKGATTELKGYLKKSEPSAAVVRGEAVTFAGRFSNSSADIQEVMLDDKSFKLTDGDFEAKLLPPLDGKLVVCVRITEDDLLEIDEWLVKFKEEDATGDPKPPVTPLAAPPVTFMSELKTEQKLGEQNEIDVVRVTLIGQTTEKEAELRLGDKLLDNVQWQEDGTFRAEVDLLKEGVNTITLSVRRANEPNAQTNSEQTQSIEIVRLTEGPDLKLVSPDNVTFETEETELKLEVTADKWTNSVSATIGGKSIELTKDKDGGSSWRAAKDLQLADGENKVKIQATNLVGKKKEQPLTITCEAKRLEINKITLSGGVKPLDVDLDVTDNKSYYVNSQPKLTPMFSETGASLVDDNVPPTSTPFTPTLKAETSKSYTLRAERGPRKSKPITFTIVYDTTEPTIEFDTIPPAQPNANVTIRGTWSDKFGLQSLVSADGKKAKLTMKTGTAKEGTWSIQVRVGKVRYVLNLTATDRAGNKHSAKCTIDLVDATATTTEPAVKLSPKINAALFEPVGELNQERFPRELRHKSTGIQLVAINFDNSTAPSLYVAKTVVTNKQWDDSDSNEAKTSVTWLQVDKKVKSNRFAGLNLLTEQQWKRVTNPRNAGVIRKYNEWLQLNTTYSLEMRPVVQKDEVIKLKYTDSNSFTSFRVGFAPPQ